MPVKRHIKHIATGVHKGVKTTAPYVGRAGKRVAHHSKKLAVSTARHSARAAKTIHRQVAIRPHTYMKDNWMWYARWHNWKWHRVVHYSTLGSYVLVVGLVVFSTMRVALAADLTNSWDFSNQSDYALDDGLEFNGNSVRLKAQQYSNDANTAALYHMNDASGTSVTDSSSNGNTGTASSAPTWGSGQINGAATLNGTNQRVSASDSSSLSLTGSHTLEGWFKPSSTFDTSASQSMGLMSKGSYRVGLDRTSGKLAYEAQNSAAGNSWTRRLGSGLNGSWTVGHTAMGPSVSYGTDVYATTTGVLTGEGEVWRWNGTTWTMVGGDGVNGSWADETYEAVMSIATNGTALYAGLGTGSGDGEVWTCELTTNCSSWTKIGGDGTGPSSAMEAIWSMTTHGGSLYVGTGSNTNDAMVWKYNGGTSWTQIGGIGLNSSWNTNYEAVFSLTSDGTYLYAGLGSGTTDSEVWRWNGTAWTQIGGDGLNSSWNTNYETVQSMSVMGGNVYAGLGTSAGDGEVWRWNGTAWTQIGGDSLNSSWGATGSQVNSMVNDGTTMYVAVAVGAASEIWTLTGSTTWTRVGASGVNGYPSAAGSTGLALANSKVYVGYGSTSSGSYFMEWSGSGNWNYIGGRFLNNSWGGHQVGSVVSSTTHNGKAYFGIGTTASPHIYEYNGTTATLVGGEGLNSSWTFNTYESVTSMISYNGSLYVGLGTGSGDGEVWRYTSGSWTKVGGDGLTSSWATATTIDSMAVYNGNLYVGVTTGSAGEVWRWTGSAWTKVGGSSTNSSWTTTQRVVTSMTVYNNQLCAGLEVVNTVGNGNVWCYDGSTWTQIGGSSNLNSGWSSTTSDAVAALISYNGYLYAAVSEVTAVNSSIWRWDGSSWTKVAGAGTASSWPDGTYTRLTTMAVYNGELYVGTGTTTAGNGDVWKYNGTSWSQAAGDSVNSSWSGGAIEVVPTMTVYKGKLYVGTGNTGNTDAQVWSVGNNTYLESSTTSFSNSWYHFAVTNDGGTAKLYINGSEQASAATSALPDNALALLLGSTYGGAFAGDGQGFFAGSLDEFRISNSVRTSFNSTPYASSPQGVVLAAAVRKSGVQDWESFTSNETLSGGTITFRLSDDEGTSWKYWNGSAWAASTNTTDANAASVISAHISDFPVTFSGLVWQAILDGDGTQQVALNSVELAANSDFTEPDTNASNILAFKANGGAALNSNDWTNGGSPYFSWTAGTDSGAGMLGYCLYLGQTSSADPTTTKGLLGTNQLDTSGACPFAVAGTSLDLATSGLLQTALSTSNTPYYLNIRAIDAAGNISGSSEQFQFRFDNTAPANPGYLSAPSGFINTKEATITWPTSGGDAASDANSGLAGLQYRIGSTSWYGDDHTGAGDINDLLANDGNYTTIDPTDFDNINDGINTVFVRTWDQAGNYSTSYVTAVLRVNTNGAPSEPQNLVATPSTNTTNSFAFSWDAPATFNTTTGNADKLVYCYVINTLPNVSNCNFTAAGETALAAGAYATQPGANTLYVVAKDDFGSVNYSSYASATFTANTPAPGIPGNIDVADVSVKTTSNWRLAVTWDVPTDVGAGVSAYKVYRSTDNSNFSQVGTSSSPAFVDSGLSQVTYYYKVKACDSANNCGAFTSVVSMLPTGKYTEAAGMTSEPTVSDVTTKKATITWSTDRVSDSKIAIGVASGDYSPSEVGNSSQVTAHKIDMDNLAAGTTYYFQARWTDVDGNTGISQEYSFTTAPAPELKEVTTVSIGLSAATLQFTIKDATKVQIQYGRSDSFGGEKSINTSLSESTYALEVNGLDDGVKYFYRLVMYDSEGGRYQSSIFSFTTPPRPSISNLRFQPLTGEPTSTQQVTWNTNIPTNSMLTYGKSGTAGTVVQSSEMKTTHEIVIRGLEDDSEYFLVSQGRDANGNLAVSDRQVFKTALDTRAPLITDIVIEPTIRGSGVEARGQIVVSWKTDEPATSQVAYADGSAATVFNNRTAEDAQLTTEHLVIISDLPPSKVYSIMPVSKDKSGNSSVTKPQAAIIGRASDSVLNIVLNTLRKVFGL